MTVAFVGHTSPPTSNSLTRLFYLGPSPHITGSITVFDQLKWRDFSAVLLGFFWELFWCCCQISSGQVTVAAMWRHNLVRAPTRVCMCICLRTSCAVQVRKGQNGAICCQHVCIITTVWAGRSEFPSFFNTDFYPRPVWSTETPEHKRFSHNWRNNGQKNRQNNTEAAAAF